MGKKNKGQSSTGLKERSIVGSYTYDIAASKCAKAMMLAKAAQYPFRVEVREV